MRSDVPVASSSQHALLRKLCLERKICLAGERPIGNSLVYSFNSARVLQTLQSTKSTQPANCCLLSDLQQCGGQARRLAGVTNMHNA